MNYTFAQLKQLWIANGGNPNYAGMAAAIAEAESGGNPNAQNVNTNGTIDRGLWQINSVHGDLSTFDPNGNARAAVQISNNGKNSFSPWATAWENPYHSGLWGPSSPVRKWIYAHPNADPQIAAAIGNNGPFGAVGGAVKDTLGPIASAFTPFTWLAGLGHLVSNLLDPKWWLRIGQGFVSAVLLLMSLGLIFRRDAMAGLQVAAKAGEVAAVA